MMIPSVPPLDPNAPVRVRLYVAGTSPNSAAALANLRGALAHCPGHRVDVEIIDVLEDPLRGVKDGILVTPMLVRLGPPLERRVLGNLHDRAALLDVLGLAIEAA